MLCLNYTLFFKKLTGFEYPGNGGQKPNTGL
jgi:hypothetical protein